MSRGHRSTEETTASSGDVDVESLLQDLPGMVYCCRRNRQRTMEFVSARCNDLCGYPPEDLLDGRRVSWSEIIHPEDRQAVWSEVQAALRDAKPFQLEYRIRHADGDTRSVWEQGRALPSDVGSPARLLGYIQDVTDAKAMVSDLGAQKAMFEALVENLQDTFSVLAPDGTVLYTSPSIERVLGHAPGERTGRGVLELVHPDDLPRAQDALRQVTSGGPDDVVSVELRARARDGRWLHMEVRAQNLLSEPHVRGIVIVARDVTEMKSLEQQLRQAQKLEALGRLAGGIAHDFNNFLTAIVGFADLLKKRSRDEESLGFIGQIENAARRSCRLTEQLLAFSRSPRPGKVGCLDLNALVVDLRSMLDRVIGEDIEVSLDLAPSLPVVRGEPTQLEQVLMNLVINARDAMPRGGVLTIETRAAARLDAGGSLLLPVAPGPFVMLAVSDTGSGIDGSVVDQIFDPFFTTKEAHHGTGLGLSTVYGIVQQYGGTLRVDTVAGEGTRFEVWLPQEEEQADQEVAIPVATPRGEEESELISVLLVEDAEPVRQVAALSLSRAGMKVLIAEDAQQAWSICSDLEEPIDVLLTDIVLPGRSGLQLAQEVSELRPGIRIVLMSGYAQEALRSEPRWPLEGVGWLDKPFTPTEIVETVRRMATKMR